MTVDNAVDEYLLVLQMTVSKRTLATYTHTLKPLRRWCSANGITDIAQLDKSLIRRFAADVSKQEGQYGLRNIMSVTRRFLRWAAGDGLLPDLTAHIRVPPIKRKPQRTLSRAEVHTLLEACDETMIGARNAALISLLLDTGLRASEVVSLNIADVNLKAQTLRVKVKGGNEYAVRFGDATRRRLATWLRERNHDAQGPLFISLGGYTTGSRLTRHGLRTMLANLGDANDIDGVTVHAFRRTFATELLRSGVPTRIVQILGRWEDPSMVELYSEQLERDDIRISLADMMNDDDD